MKKAFTLIEMITALAISAIILTIIGSVTVFSTKIINKQQRQSEIYDEVTLVDSLVKKFVDRSENIVVEEHKISSDTEFIEYLPLISEITLNNTSNFKLDVLDNVIIETEDNLIILSIYIDELKHFSFTYSSDAIAILEVL